MGEGKKKQSSFKDVGKRRSANKRRFWRGITGGLNSVEKSGKGNRLVGEKRSKNQEPSGGG